MIGGFSTPSTPDANAAQFLTPLNLPEIKEWMADTGSKGGGNSSEEFAAFIRADRIKTGKWIEHLQIVPE
jgi:hypothetical protein